MRYAVEVAGRTFVVEVNGGDVRVDGQPVDAVLTPVPGTPLRILTLGGERHAIASSRGAAPGEYTLWTDRFRLDVEAVDERARALRAITTSKSDASGPAPLVAPMPGLIVRVEVAEGDVVEAGQGLIVMEAMKMENELRAAAKGTVARILVQPGVAVEKGALLVQLT